MTNREFFNAIVNGELNDEVIEKAKSEIVKLDERNAKRASKPSKKSIENEPIKASIREFLTDGSHLASEIASGLDLSVSKVSALCRQMVGDGLLTVEDIKVKGKGMQKSYTLAQSRKERTKRAFFFWICFFRTLYVRKTTCIYFLNQYNYIR